VLVGAELLSGKLSRGKRGADRLRGQPRRQEPVVDPTPGGRLHLARRLSDDQDALHIQVEDAGGSGTDENDAIFEPRGWDRSAQDVGRRMVRKGLARPGEIEEHAPFYVQGDRHLAYPDGAL
jgi:hypothetical protein